jgi:hypothetical protein
VAEGTTMYDILLQGVVWHRVVLHVARWRRSGWR